MLTRQPLKPSTVIQRTCCWSRNRAPTSWPRCNSPFCLAWARRGALRAQIEAVRVDEAYRNRGLGAAIFTWAINESRRRHCALVQLTTDKSRTTAHRFYERLGFVASHEGMKLALREPRPQ
jgi:GNAT superfamily N-acetyltransferase